jgi:hypothetical protein
MDKRLRSGRWRGEVLQLRPDGCERLAYVYGATKEEMRRRKRLTASAVNKEVR